MDHTDTPPGEIALPDAPIGLLGRTWAQALLLVLVFFSANLWHQFVPDFVPDGQGGTRLGRTAVGLSGVDGFFHIKMAYLYRTGEVMEAGPDFHWTRESLWNGEYTDKDFLYHLFLMPFTFGADGPGDTEALLVGAKLGAAVAATLVALALFGALRMLGVRHAWAYVLLLPMMGGTLLPFRLNLCRSYVLSIAFALAGWGLMARGRRMSLFFLSVVYTLSYTASHLLLALWFVRAVAMLTLGPGRGQTRWGASKQNLLTGSAIALGIGLGLLLHPNSVGLMHLWWVQNVVVLALSHRDSIGSVLDMGAERLFGVQTQYAQGAPIELGVELNPAEGPMILFSAIGTFFALMVLPLLAAVARWRPSREALWTSAAALALFCMYMLNNRFIEYAAPFMTLAVGVWMTGILSSRGCKVWRKLQPRLSAGLLYGGLVVLVAAGGWFWFSSGVTSKRTNRGRVEKAARWLHEHEEAHGKVVFHDRWDDFTVLFFYASECDYLVGLDPTFMLEKDRERYLAWHDISHGKTKDFLPVVRDTFGASYILVNRNMSNYLYVRCVEEAKAGKLRLCIRDVDDDWSLYEIVP